MSDALPVTYPLKVYHGTTFTQAFRWKPDGTTPQDLRDWTATMWVRAPGLAPTVTLTHEDYLTLTEDGQVVILLQAEATQALRPGVYLYNLDLVDTFGDSTRFLRGEITVVRDAEPL